MALNESISQTDTHNVSALSPTAKTIKEQMAAIGLSLTLIMGATGCEKNQTYVDEKCTSVEDDQSAKKLFDIALKNRQAKCISSFEEAVEKATAQDPRYVLGKMIENDEAFELHEELYIKAIDAMMDKPDDFPTVSECKDEPIITNMEFVADSIEKLQTKWGDKNPEVLEAAKLTMYGKMLISLHKIRMYGNLKFILDHVNEIDDPGARDAIRLRAVSVLKTALYDRALDSEGVELILSILNEVEKKTDQSNSARSLFVKIGFILLAAETEDELSKEMKELTEIVSIYPQYSELLKCLEYVVNVAREDHREYEKDKNADSISPNAAELLIALSESEKYFYSQLEERKTNSH